MDYTVLRNELINDPLGRGYAAMSDLQASDSLNIVNRTKTNTSVTGAEIFEAAVPAELDALTDVQKQKFYAICSLNEIKIASTNTKAALLAMFGAGTSTRVALIALASRPCSRAEELGLPTIQDGYVTSARIGIF